MEKLNNKGLQTILKMNEAETRNNRLGSDTNFRISVNKNIMIQTEGVIR